MTFLTAVHPWIKALHIVAVIFWMAGLYYLPRLFVYHADSAPGSEQAETFKVMERRLLRGIVNPAMAAAWLFGLALLLTPGVVDWQEGWLHAKLALVLAMSGFHAMLARWRKDFERDANRRPARFYRIVNEIAPLLTIAIVVLVVVRPF